MAKQIKGKESLLVKIYKDWNEETINKEMFMIQDILGVLMRMERTDTTLVFIQNYYGTQEEKQKALEEVLSIFKDKDNIVILSWAYVSITEFPESEYYDPSFGEYSEHVQKSIMEGKKPVPYDEIIERESKLLESVGFIDINDFVGYEHCKAYLYGNSLGNEVINFINIKNI